MEYPILFAACINLFQTILRSSLSQTALILPPFPIQDLAFTHARDSLINPKSPLDWANLIYSFCINFPGASTFRNTLSFLRNLRLADGTHLDMGVVNILRDRERGIPRYNAFRCLFHLPPMKSFTALTGGDALLATEVPAIYSNEIESVDLLIGSMCEPKPKGFGFSDGVRTHGVTSSEE